MAKALLAGSRMLIANVRGSTAFGRGTYFSCESKDKDVQIQQDQRKLNASDTSAIQYIAESDLIPTVALTSTRFITDLLLFGIEIKYKNSKLSF
ncbi:hypothetical protein AcW1_007755 [Taiwanofungus camphoratus]|nr:hypothetical protein AcW1_007755 [Antrodia cinnamomea]